MSVNAVKRAGIYFSDRLPSHKHTFLFFTSFSLCVCVLVCVCWCGLKNFRPVEVHSCRLEFTDFSAVSRPRVPPQASINNTQVLLLLWTSAAINRQTVLVCIFQLEKNRCISRSTQNYLSLIYKAKVPKIAELQKCLQCDSLMLFSDFCYLNCG